MIQRLKQNAIINETHLKKPHSTEVSSGGFFNERPQGQWFKDLIEDCKGIIVEGETASRWALVQTYHQLGVRILQEYDNFEREKIYGEKIVSGVSLSLGKGERTIWRAVQFAKTYPELDKVPEGKSISWNKIITKYLPQPREELLKEEPPKRFHFEYPNLTLIQAKQMANKLIDKMEEGRKSLVLFIENYDGFWILRGYQDMQMKSKISGCPNPKGHADCIRIIDLVQSEFGKKFVNYAKQIGAIHKILKAGFTEDEIGEAMNEMDEDKFWSEKGWDLINVAGYMERKNQDADN